MSTALRAIRPEPHRGDLVAAGGVVLAVAMVVLNVRMGGTWGKGVLLSLDALAAALLLGMGLLAEPEWREEEQALGRALASGPLGTVRRARDYIGVLLLSGYAVGVLAVGRLAAVLGADSVLGKGTGVWVSLLLAGGAAALWRARAHPIFVLVASIFAGSAAISVVRWIFDPHISGYRVVLLLLFLVFAALHGRTREARRREAVLFVDAAGLAALGLALTIGLGLAGVLVNGGLTGGATNIHGPAGWLFVVLVAGCLLVAFAAVEGEPGPGFLGFFTLLAFAGTAGIGAGSASLVGWPLFLLVLAAIVIGAGLRPSRPLPPEPGGGRAETIPLPRQEPHA